jgi:hypothetical protein
MLSQGIPHELKSHSLGILWSSCPFLMVSEFGHSKEKGKPLKNDVEENTRSFQDVTFFYI